MGVHEVLDPGCNVTRCRKGSVFQTVLQVIINKSKNSISECENKGFSNAVVLIRIKVNHILVNTATDRVRNKQDD